ncbi:MAG TPA: FKBP-type peptidyl-prolyl cis-trans isomerase [Burkholderiales bacterium]|nr:FKBP-type peptidyl-prolyl cis-trans isomerase [Burkholderiales bacterium]
MRIIAVLVFVMALAGCKGGQTTASVELETDEQKTFYALGMAVSQPLYPFSLSEEEMAYVQAGLADGVMKREARVDMDTFGPKIEELARVRVEQTVTQAKAAGSEFMKKAEAEPGATKTASGVVVKVLTEGTGEKPTELDTVKVHYHGTLADGTVFDRSVERDEPVTIPLGNVIKCWVEGVQEIKVGGKSRLVCPPETAYGDRGSAPRIPPGATLAFEVELLEIVK